MNRVTGIHAHDVPYLHKSPRNGFGARGTMFRMTLDFLEIVKFGERCKVLHDVKVV